jgi:hypothetical protein
MRSRYLIILLFTAATILTSCSRKQATCSGTPWNALDPSDVTPLSLTNSETNASSMANYDRSIGFSIPAQANQKLVYQTDANICVWVFTPNGQLLTSGVLPTTGTYTLQVAALQGSQTFDLSVKLEDSENTDSTAPNFDESASGDETSSGSSLPDPDEFIQDYYAGLNERDYAETWEKLSPTFKELAEGYASYVDWWDSVDHINLSKVRVREVTEQRAVIDVNLEYEMRDGRVITDSKGRIILSINSNANTWQIEHKLNPN